MLAFETYIASWDSAVDSTRIAYFKQSGAEHQRVFERMRGQYRPLSVAGTQSAFGIPSFCSVWVRSDGRPWSTRHGIRGNAFQAAFDQARRSGYRPVFIDGFSGSAGAMFNSIWERDDGPVWNAEFGIPDHDYQRRFDQRCREGLRLRSVSPYLQDGKLVYATVWDNTPGPGWSARHGMSLDAFNDEADGLAARQHVLTWAKATRVGDRESYAALWEHAPGVVARTRQAMNAGTFSRYNQEMRRDNLRLRTLSPVARGKPRDSILGMRIQQQLKSNWCWVACAASIAEHYGISRSQCQLVNQDFEQFGNTVDCCGDDTDGLPCNNGGDLARILRKLGLVGRTVAGHLPYADIETELIANRPVGIYVIWNGGGHHLMVITGCQMGEFVRVSDPAGATSTWFPYRALTDGSRFAWNHSVLTKRP